MRKEKMKTILLTIVVRSFIDKKTSLLNFD